MNETVFIYTLIDPRNSIVFYVGSTIKPKIRLAKHKLEARNKRLPNTKDIFIREMIEQGYSPELNIIERTTEDAAFARELFWIEYFRSIGIELLNQQDLSNRVHMKQSRGKRSRPDIYG